MNFKRLLSILASVVAFLFISSGQLFAEYMVMAIPAPSFNAVYQDLQQEIRDIMPALEVAGNFRIGHGFFYSQEMMRGMPYEPHISLQTLSNSHFYPDPMVQGLIQRIVANANRLPVPDGFCIDHIKVLLGQRGNLYIVAKTAARNRDGDQARNFFALSGELDKITHQQRLHDFKSHISLGKITIDNRFVPRDWTQEDADNIQRELDARLNTTYVQQTSPYLSNNKYHDAGREYAIDHLEVALPLDMSQRQARKIPSIVIWPTVAAVPAVAPQQFVPATATTTTTQQQQQQQFVPAVSQLANIEQELQTLELLLNEANGLQEILQIIDRLNNLPKMPAVRARIETLLDVATARLNDSLY